MTNQNYTLKFLATFLCAIVVSCASAWAQVSIGGVPKSQIADNVQSIDQIPVLQMRTVDVERLKAEDLDNETQKKPVPWRFGDNMDVNIDPNTVGKREILPDGSMLWRLGIESPGAFHINLTFSDFQLPEGATMYIYNDGFSHVIGGFTAENNQADGVFATTLVKGEKIYIEYSAPPSIGAKTEQIPFRLTRVTHGYRDAYKTIDAFGQAGACNNNVNCPTASAWACQKRSVVMLVSGSSGFCTGTLVNNVNQDQKPYVLTANHCYSNPSAWVFWFNWEAAGCPNPATSPANQSMSGATLRARRTNTDFCLVEINAPVPASYNASFSGWDASGATPTSGACIHHPRGDIKKISFVAQPFISSTYAVLTTDNGWRAIWSSGVTEPASSGSALYDQNQRLVGQLYGGPSSCTATDKSDYYGKVSSSWTGSSAADQLKSWLDPANTGATTLDALGCTDFSLALNKNADTICPNTGLSRTYTLGATSFGGFAGNVTLSASGQPGGSTVSFSQTTFASGTSVQMTVTLPSGIANGTYSLTITGTSGTTTRTTALSMSAFTNPVNPPNLNGPANLLANTSLLPLFTWTGTAGATSYRLEIANDSSFLNIHASATLAGNIYQLPTAQILAAGNVYFWRVIPITPCGNGTPSATRVFQTNAPLFQTEIPTFEGTFVADTSFLDVATGWTHYIKRALTAPISRRNLVILSVLNPPNSSILQPNQISTTVTKVGGSATPQYANSYMRNPSTWFVANRYWRINTPESRADLPTRFYMMAIDRDSLFTKAQGVADRYSVYKFNDLTIDANPTSHARTKFRSTALFANPPITPFGTHFAIEMTPASLSGFGGVGVGGGGLVTVTSNYTVYPNPAIEKLNVNVWTDNETVEYKIYNAVGQLVWSKTENSSVSLTIPTVNWAAGAYVLTIKSNTLDEKIKIAKQ